MEFVKIRNGEPFEGTVPEKLELPNSLGLSSGTKAETFPSMDEKALIRWMFREGYVPKEEWEE